MKLSVAVLSSILLVCSVTTANPIHPSSTASTEYVSSTAIPSSTTSTEFNPSATPNANGIDLGSLDSFSDDIQDLFKNYLKKQHDYDEHKKKCKLIKLQFEDQQKLVKHTRERFGNLRRTAQRNGRGNSKYSDDDEMKELRNKFQEGHSRLGELQRKKNKCRFELSHFNQQLDFAKVNLVEFIFGASFNLESLDGQLLLILSDPYAKQYLGELCGGEQSSACSDDSDQNSSDGQQQHQNLDDDSFEEIDLNDPSDEKQRQDPQPQTQSGSRSFGQRAPAFRRRAHTFRRRARTFRQKASAFRQRFVSFKHRVSTGLRKAFSRLGSGFRSLVERFRREN
ncbi:hypothetical protein QVD99_003202 [Batrachochytrium dendrobatidis]|nr:hypothetical protein QVD99_003202 [Batrachochytrium dendrobatidis]